MFSLNNIASQPGSRRKSKRLGRGAGSGKGTYAGRGLNGQNSRSGGGVAPWFEGGQTPLFRRTPKLKGFSNARFTLRYTPVNLSQLEILAQKGIVDISKETLLEHKIVRSKTAKVKVLAGGELTIKVNLNVDKISAEALEKIQKLGGSVTTI